MKDIELLYFGKVAEWPDEDDLFLTPVARNLAEVHIKCLLLDGILKKRFNVDGQATWGDQIKLAVHVKSGLPVDLFAATEENWFNLLVCRTGPAESNMRICNRAIERGMKWEPYGPGLANRETGEVVFRATDERGLFARLGLPYEEPEKRR